MAPYMLAWSVRAIARIPCALARLARSSSFTALVRNEYCEWTCRWTNSRATSPWLTTHRQWRDVPDSSWVAWKARSIEWSRHNPREKPANALRDTRRGRPAPTALGSRESPDFILGTHSRTTMQKVECGG